jgi:ribulose-5-phosphate 4-epimerase/fuculose-1-phosphate aldolase
MNERHIREELVYWGASLFARGLTSGSSGNISVRMDDCVLITPTNSCLGRLDPAKLARVDLDGRHLEGDPPSKELPLHLALLSTRPAAGAVVHLHSPWATALSCASDLDPDNCVIPYTPYVVMRFGKVGLVPYFRPGDRRSGDLIRSLGGRHSALLLANHGPVVCGHDIASAVFNSEELEDAARLMLLHGGRSAHPLTAEQVRELTDKFPVD